MRENEEASFKDVGGGHRSVKKAPLESEKTPEKNSAKEQLAKALQGRSVGRQRQTERDGEKTRRKLGGRKTKKD